MPIGEENDKLAALNTEPTKGLGSLTAQQLDALRGYDAPTVANAIETFNIRLQNEGFMHPQIRCIFPEMGVMVGYAVTARIRSAEPRSEGEPKVDTLDWWDLIQKIPVPRVVVMEDIDDPPAVGSAWGEVQANIHKALGCVGVVTNGGVRDLNEVGPLGFHFFAPHVVVSHAYARMLDFGSPVRVGGLTVHTGDLIHADRHGVQMLPLEIAADIPRAADGIFTFEHRFIDYCKSQDFTSEGLKALWRQLVRNGAANH